MLECLFNQHTSMFWLTNPGRWVILGTLGIALMLDMLPLPLWVDRFRPPWVALVAIYWCMALPERFGLLTAWIAGLFLDVARGAVLGQHALGLVIVAFLTLKTYRQVRVLPFWQQSLSVAGFLVTNQLIIFWINGMLGYPAHDVGFLAPAIGGFLIWPWIFIVLRDLRRLFEVA